MAFRKVWGALAGQARILWTSRGRRRRPEGRLRGEALESRDDARKRRFRARGGRGTEAPKATLEATRRQVEAQRDPSEMRRHAFSGAWPKRSPEALARRCGKGRGDPVDSRRRGETPRASQIFNAPPGHPGERVSIGCAIFDPTDEHFW